MAQRGHEHDNRRVQTLKQLFSLGLKKFSMLLYNIMIENCTDLISLMKISHKSYGVEPAEISHRCSFHHVG